MSSWSAKLERVAFPFLEERDHPVEQGKNFTRRAPMHFDTEDAASPLPTDPRGRLDALRERIAGILTRSAPPKRLSASPAKSDLPFVREETPLGPLYVRVKRLSVAHRVGRVSVSPAKEASAGMLALLALDPGLAQLAMSRALYVDTETTGLSAGAGTVPFLIGLAWFEPESSALVVEQMLLRELGEEAPMFAKRVARASMFVSYNGKSFDLPLLRTRAVLGRLPPILDIAHLDLVHVARRLHRHRLEQVNLKTVEAKVLGFERTDDISSGDVCGRYTHFLRTGNDSALSAVVDHNEWDIVSMAALVGIYGEPLSGLGALDWAFVARTVRRAGSLDMARDIAERAVAEGGGSEAIRARGEIAKARGDKAQALADFASLVDSVDDPSLRLELAKLYEHHAKAPVMALEVALRGTGEGVEASSRRVQRLQGKRRRPLR